MKQGNRGLNSSDIVSIDNFYLIEKFVKTICYISHGVTNTSLMKNILVRLHFLCHFLLEVQFNILEKLNFCSELNLAPVFAVTKFWLKVSMIYKKDTGYHLGNFHRQFLFEMRFQENLPFCRHSISHLLLFIKECMILYPKLNMNGT